MSNGRPWTQSDTDTLERMQGRSFREIAKAMKRPLSTVKAHAQARGIKGYGSRAHWTRKDWLMADAAGLDFQISF